MVLPKAGYELDRFLEAWGIDIKHMTEVTISIRRDDVCRVTVTYLYSGDTEKLNETMTKEFAIVELKNE